MRTPLQETSWLNNILVVINFAVISVILGVGGYFADFSNWEYSAERKDPQPHGFINGFLPYGWTGVFAVSWAVNCWFLSVALLWRLAWHYQCVRFALAIRLFQAITF